MTKGTKEAENGDQSPEAVKVAPVVVSQNDTKPLEQKTIKTDEKPAVKDIKPPTIAQKSSVSDD